ncbi:MAG: GIY-YIG nuclease family protein [Candidatus Heimdallarchaeota archaeon]|nr:GIY-YIG nuclease family protein [Candidatus Heimdallarchaeota archaeon]MCK4290174.1 GIY-YIG nuclease family protein [Candidatus Heimdallarchaeota archaeon]
MSENRGTYLLFIFVEQDISLTIGALGSKLFQQGNYIYIGSALGPGGLKKRIARHIKQEKKIFWHIDYLLKNNFVKIIAYGEILSDHKIECGVVNQIIRIFHEKSSIIKNFGSSDCNCKSHLLYFNKKPINELIKQIKIEMKNSHLEVTHL